MANKPTAVDDLDIGTSEADLRAFLATEHDGTDPLAFQLKVSLALVALLRRLQAIEAHPALSIPPL